jgi:hypothetical protein
VLCCINLDIQEKNYMYSNQKIYTHMVAQV